IYRKMRYPDQAVACDRAIEGDYPAAWRGTGASLSSRSVRSGQSRRRTMPLAPDPPFPKSQGSSIRSKDWNDAVNEVIRLDNAKVNRSGDAITGTLTVSGNLGVGTVSPGARLEIKGAAILDNGGDAQIYTGTGSSELNRFLNLLNSPGAASASG